MINKAINTISPSIKTMAWIERYGGLAKVAERTVSVEKGTTKQKYPISSSVTGLNCWENKRYLDLAPNDSFYSVVYFEQIGDVDTDPNIYGKRHKYYSFSAKLRFVAWLNYKKMGVTSTSISGNLQSQTINRLLKDHSKIYDSIQKVTVSNIKIESAENTHKVFANYTYENLERLLYYPYDCFSLVFDIQWRVPLNCVDDVTIGTAITCIDLNNPE